MKYLLLLVVLLSGCASTPDTGSLLCTNKQYKLYEDAGLPWDSCDKDKQIYAHYFFKGKTWADLDQEFTKFITKRLKKIKRWKDKR